jgi:serine/threonine-protein kinase ULK4
VHEIGRSKTAVVHKGRRKNSILYHALKCVDKTEQQRTQHEVSFLHSLSHPHIMRFFEWFETANHFWLILEYCTGGSVMELLLQDILLAEDSVRLLSGHVVLALQFLLHNGIVYGNLKPATILIDDQGRLKLSDFSLARRLLDPPPSSSAARNRRMTPAYTAPELLQHGAVPTPQSDVWALGCLLHELASGRPPYISSNFKTLLDEIMHAPPPQHPKFSPAFNDLLARCLAKDPASRLSLSEVLKHPFWDVKFPSLSLPDQPPAASSRLPVDVLRLSRAMVRSPPPSTHPQLAPTSRLSQEVSSVASAGMYATCPNPFLRPLV